MASLITISLGPVQEFIAASRKTRDLWLGSKLLCDAARAAASVFRAPVGTLIFPTEPALRVPDAPVANKVLAIVHDGDPKALADAAEANARRVVQDYFDEAMTQITARHAAGYVDLTLAQQQIDGFLEWYAAWTPYEPLPDQAAGAPDPAYIEALDRSGRLLGSRKALRDFPAITGVEGAAKSSLNPNLETVFRDNGNPVSWRHQLPQAARSALRVKGSEQLDAISLVKRHAYQQRFPSLSRVTIDPFIRRLAREPGGAELLGKLRNLAAAIGDSPAVEYFHADEGSILERYAAFPYDSQLFYDDGERDDELAPSQKVGAKAFFDEVQRQRVALAIPELPTYVAVVAADGDKMGEVLGNLRSAPEHQALSAALADFSKRAGTITADHNGAFVYSGGDDVLAFLPLDRVLAYVEALRTAFAAIVGPAAGTIDVSLSAGVAIGHYSDSLQELLGWARDAERAAKQANDGARNALAVALHTRGGVEEPRTVVHQWSTHPVEKRWQQWIEWHRHDLIPDGAAYELQTLDRELRPLWQARQLDIVDLRRREAGRILNRKRAARGTAKLAEDRITTLVSLIGAGEHDLRLLVDELIISRRLAAATDVARGRLATQEEET